MNFTFINEYLVKVLGMGKQEAGDAEIEMLACMKDIQKDPLAVMGDIQAHYQDDNHECGHLCAGIFFGLALAKLSTENREIIDTHATSLH